MHTDMLKALEGRLVGTPDGGRTLVIQTYPVPSGRGGTYVVVFAFEEDRARTFTATLCDEALASPGKVDEVVARITVALTKGEAQPFPLCKKGSQ